MPRSALLTANLTDLPPAPVEVAARGADPVVFEPPFPAEPQRQSNWCWAAVSAAIRRHYRPNEPKEQCELAADEHAAQLAAEGFSPVCCPPGDNPAADRAFPIDTALVHLHHFRGEVNLLPPDYAVEIVAELNAGQSFVAQYHATQPGLPDHVVVISGYQFGPGWSWIRVDDPAPINVGSREEWDYDEFFAAHPDVTLYRTTAGI